MDKRLILLSLCLIQINGISSDSYRKEALVLDNYGKAWKLHESGLKERSELFLNIFAPQIQYYLSESNITSNCIEGFNRIVNGIRKLNTWAIQFIDSSGRLVSGAFEGTVADFGSYDECLNIRSNDDDLEYPITGQYCTLLHHPPLLHHRPTLQKFNSMLKDGNLQFSQVINDILIDAEYYSYIQNRIGFCVPSSCTLQDIRKVAKKVFKGTQLSHQISNCEVKQPIVIENYQIFALILVSLFILLAVIGTTVDLVDKWSINFSEVNEAKQTLKTISESRCLRGLYYYLRERKDNKHNFVKCFSLYTNGAALFNAEPKSTHLSSLHGLRVMSLSWIILCHTYTNFTYKAQGNLKGIRGDKYDYAFQVILNGWPSVESFFFLGGLIVAYIGLQTFSLMKGRLNFIYFVCHRYWRLTPSLLMIICLMFLLPLIGSGPLWKEYIGSEVQKCTKSWWFNILYINNFQHADAICLQPTWYLSNDFQLYILSYFILFLLNWKSMWGIFFTVILILASAVSVATVTVLLDFFPSLAYLNTDVRLTYTMVQSIHWQTYSHLGSYCVGVLTGYFLYKYEKIHIKKVYQVFGWLLSSIFSIAIIYGAQSWNAGIKPGLIITIIYSSSYRIGWSLCLAWVAVCCVKGYGGPVNSILSWKIFLPLSRVTYMMFLIHPVVMWIRYSSLRETVRYDHYNMVYLYFGHLIIIIGCAFVCSLLFEIPLIRTENLFLSFHKRKEQDGNDNQKSSDVSNRKAEMI